MALWARRLGSKHYSLTEDVPNDRLASDPPGWTAEDLREALLKEPVLVAAMDFPFSLPAQLLRSLDFAKRVGLPEPIGTWASYLGVVAPRLQLDALNFQAFQGWRDKSFWLKRRTDVAANGQPPLKDKFQNLFQMTLLGATLLRRLRDEGWSIPPLVTGTRHTVIEVHPGATCRRLGLTGYKSNAPAAIESITRALVVSGITLELSPAIRERCAMYTSGGADHDLADALVALGTGILWCESKCEMALAKGAPDSAVEGAIWWPTAQEIGRLDGGTGDGETAPYE